MSKRTPDNVDSQAHAERRRNRSAPSCNMDHVLAQTLSMDQELGPSTLDLLASHDVPESALWQNLGLGSGTSSSSGFLPTISTMFEPFATNGIGSPVPTPLAASFESPALGPTDIPSTIALPLDHPDLPLLPGKQVDQSTHVPDNAEGIFSWIYPGHTDSPGYIDGHDHDLLALIKASKQPKPAKPYLLTDKAKKMELPLSKPSLDPTGTSDMAIVGTCSLRSKKHLILVLDTGQQLQHGAYPNPDDVIRSMALIRNPVRELHWISEQRLMVAHGFEATIFDINQQQQMAEHSKLEWVHTDEIREISFNARDSRMFAAGGFDQILSINDMTRTETTVSAVRIDDVIGSVRWGSFDEHSVTMTSDDGRFFQFDPRTAMRKAALFIDAQKLHLYSHCIFDPNSILLGFGDGEILQVDIRKNAFCQGTRDPYIQSIGDMIFDQQSQTLLFSGQPDFTLWRYDCDKAAALAWSRPSLSASPTQYYCHAVFGRQRDTIIKTNEYGGIGVYRLIHGSNFV